MPRDYTCGVCFPLRIKVERCPISKSGLTTVQIQPTLIPQRWGTLVQRRAPTGEAQKKNESRRGEHP